MGSDSFKNCAESVTKLRRCPSIRCSLLCWTSRTSARPSRDGCSALGVTGPEDLRGADPEVLFERAAALAGHPEDPCLLDTFTAAVAFAETGDDRPWWAFSRERIAREAP